MNNISDKNVVFIILVTILIVFAFIFAVKSPERKIIESPIMWKEDFSSTSDYDNETVELNNFINNKQTYITFLI